MATDTNILREFLVTLGFKVESADKFKESIESATRLIGQLGTAIEAIGTLGLKGLNKTADSLVNIKYLSQQLSGTPMQSIMAFNYALGRSGVSAEDAMGSLKSFSMAVMSSPGLLPALTGYGVSATDATGKMRDMTQILYDFGKWAKQSNESLGSQFQAFNVGEQLGLSKEMVLALERNPGMYAQQDINKMNRQGHNEKYWEDQAAKAKKWQDQWANFVQTIQHYTMDLFMKLAPIFERIIHIIDALGSHTGNLSTKFIALGAALLPILGFGNPLVAVILGLAGAIAILVSDFQNWQQTGQSALPWADWAPQLQGITKDLRDIGKALSDVFGGANLGNLGGVLKGFVKDELQALKDMLDALLHGLEAIKKFKSGDVKGGFGKVGEALKSAGTAMFTDQFKALKDEVHNWTTSPPGQKQGPVGKTVGAIANQMGSFFSSKGLDAEHVRGILAGIFAEGGMNPDVISGKKRGPKYGAFGIGQWLGPRRDALFAKYGPNPTLAQQLEFLWSELNGGDKTSNGAVLRAGGAEGTLDAYINTFMRPRAGAETIGDLTRGRNWLAQNPGNTFTQINNKVDIHVHGSNDPHATADAVARQQQRVYGNTVRWNKPAAS
jgi:hypothetical protein